MIVHVLDRGREADIGPVAVACGDPEIAEAVRAAGGRAVLTDPDLPSGSDRVHAALAELDPDAAARRGGQPARRRADAGPGHPARCRRAAGRSGVRHRHSRGADPSTRRPNTRVVRQGRLRVRRRPDGGAGAVFLAPADPLGRRAALAPCRHLRLSARGAGALVALPPSPLERREKLEQLRALEAGMRIALRAAGARRRSASIRPDDLARARAMSGAEASADDERHRSPSRACRAPIPTWPAATPIPAMTTLPCESFEAAMDAVREGTRGAGDAAMREQPGRPGARHPPPAARVRPVRHRRAVPARRTLPAGRARRDDRRPEAGALAHRGAGPGAAHPAQAGSARRWSRRTPPARRNSSRNGATRRRRAIASSLAAEIYGLDILRRNVEDAAHNTTRFYVMSPTPADAGSGARRT